MLSITTKSPYALRALVELHRRGRRTDRCRSPSCAGGGDIPVQFLEQLFATLRRAGLLRSQRGVKGGYSFERPAAEITVLEVVELLDGPLGGGASGIFAEAAGAAAARARRLEHRRRGRGRGPGGARAHVPHLTTLARIPSNIAEYVGRTPIVRLSRITDGLDVELYAKLESFNPGGSVKDRIGVAMIEAAEAEGRIVTGPHDDRRGDERQHRDRPGVRLRGQGLPAGADDAPGDEPRAGGPAAALRRRGARHRVAGRDGRGGGGGPGAGRTARATFLPDQFSNPANPAIHRRTTGPEILAALEDRVDVFVAGVGTGGTITGAGEAIRERCPGCRIVAVEPAASAVLSGGRPGPHKIQGIGAGFVPAGAQPGAARRDHPGRRRGWRSRPPARLARREGILAGISCGAAVAGALELARRPELRGARIVTVLPGLRGAVRLDAVLRAVGLDQEVHLRTAVPSPAGS